MPTAKKNKKQNKNPLILAITLGQIVKYKINGKNLQFSSDYERTLLLNKREEKNKNFFC